MESQLPALLIVIPLLGAPLCVILRNRRLVQPFALAVAWATFVVAITLAIRIQQDGTWIYALGDWAAPWGIEYRVDTLSSILAVIVSGIGAWVLTYAPQSIAHEIDEGRHYLFYTAYLLCITGLLGISITGDLFNVFVFLEVSALSGYVLIALGQDRRALTAALQYLILGTIGATFILIGIGLMYMMTGTLNMADMAVQLAEVGSNRTILVAFAFFTVGVCIKMALFPLHAWLPNSYTYAPSVVTAFLASTATKVAVYVLLRFVLSVFGVEFATSHNLPLILMTLALTGIFVASTVAIFQQNVKRILAYSSVAQIGYMVLGISFFSVTGLTGGIVHLFNHALTKGGLFLAMGCIALRIGSVQIKDMAGLGRQMPWTMLAWVLGGLSLIGIPATTGFISKWYLISAAMESGRWWLAALVLLSSLLAVVYIWRVVEVAYFQPPPEDREPPKEAPLSMLIPTWLLVFASWFFGWFDLAGNLARSAAQTLIGGGS